MTSSETRTEAVSGGATSGATGATGPGKAPLPSARARGRGAVPGWLVAAALCPPGWLFILRTVRWHFTPSAIMLMICWAAVVATGYWVVRMALTASTEIDDDWFAVRGRRDELEREKKSLLKAIKELEFDRETGKISAADATALIQPYRVRAIDVMKALDAETGASAGAREQILAEVRARLAVDGKVKAAQNKAAQKKAGKAKATAIVAAATPVAAAVPASAAAGDGAGEARPVAEAADEREASAADTEASGGNDVPTASDDPAVASTAEAEFPPAVVASASAEAQASEESAS